MANSDESLARVTAAVEHARVMVYREETPDAIEEEVAHLAEIGAATMPPEDELAVAVELLALLPPDALEETVRVAEQRRANSEGPH